MDSLPNNKLIFYTVADAQLRLNNSYVILNETTLVKVRDVIVDGDGDDDELTRLPVDPSDILIVVNHVGTYKRQTIPHTDPSVDWGDFPSGFINTDNRAVLVSLRQGRSQTAGLCNSNTNCLTLYETEDGVSFYNNLSFVDVCMYYGPCLLLNNYPTLSDAVTLLDTVRSVAVSPKFALCRVDGVVKIIDESGEVGYLDGLTPVFNSSSSFLKKVWNYA